jgi:hypothetical protein
MPKRGTSASTNRQNKDVWLTVPIEQRHHDIVELAAAREGRAVAAYVRHLVLVDLRERGLVDEDFNPIAQPAAEAS